MNLPNLNNARKRTKEKVNILENYKVSEEQKLLGKNKKYYIKTYGCQMNEHDSENIKAILEDMGYTNTDNMEDANLIIVEAVKHTGTDGTVLKDAVEVHESNGDFTPLVQRISRETADDKAKHEAQGKYYFYVLLCNDGSFYGGFTNDLEHRLKMHNLGKGAKYTKTRRPVRMIYHEQFDDKRLALKREYWFKHHSRAWKEKFLHEHNIKF